MKKILLILFILIAIGCRCFNLHHYLGFENLMTSLESIKNTPPIIYIVLLSLVPVFFLPTFPAIIIAGYLYDPLWGFCYAMIGATIGASFSFLFGRYIAGQKIREKLLQYLENKSGKKLEDYMDEKGWKMVIILRLIPLFPFTPLNYALGLSGVSFKHYLYGTAVGIAPACAIFIFFSASLSEVMQEGISPQIIIATALMVILFILLHFGVKKIR